MIDTAVSTQKFQLDTIESAIEDIKAGKVIIVVDDEDRENEGDFLASAQMATPEMINFMATHGRGLICTPITEQRSKELQLDLMVGNNTDPMETAFTVSIDLKGNGVTTGISASDRAKTVNALVNPDIKPWDLSRPGHIFPLKAKNGGTLRRVGHTEAAIDFARLAGHEPAGVIVEIMNEDGTMARLPQLMKVAKEHNLKIVSIESLVAYSMEHDSLIEIKEDFQIATKYGDFRLRAYSQTNNEAVHMVLSKGDWASDEPVLVRINSTTVNNDVLGILTANGHLKLDHMFAQMDKDEKGAMLFINQHHDAATTLNRLQTLKEQQASGHMAAPKKQMDTKDFGIGAQILHDIGISKIRLMSNTTQEKRVGMVGYGLEIVEYVSY